MNITQMKNCIKGSGIFLVKFDRSQMFLGTYGMIFFALISAFALKMHGTPIARICSVIMCMLLALVVVCSIISLVKPLTVKKRVFYFTFASTLMSLMFLLDSAMFFDALDVPYYGIVYVVPVLFAIYSICVMRPNPQRKGKPKGKIVLSGPLITVSGAGFWLGRALRPALAQLEQPALYCVLAIGFYVVGCLLSLCSFGFLYLYYIRVLESKGVKLDD